VLNNGAATGDDGTAVGDPTNGSGGLDIDPGVETRPFGTTIGSCKLVGDDIGDVDLLFETFNLPNVGE